MPTPDRFARLADLFQLLHHGGALRVAPFRVEGVGIRTRMDFADRSADALRRLDLAQLGVDEHRDHDAGSGQALYGLLEGFLLGNNIQATFGGDLVPALGHQHRHLRLDAARDADHLVGRGHLEVQLDVGELAQPAHILVLDMAPVLAQVHRDAVGAAEVRLDRAHTASCS